ncbi:MAG: M23 family metallopeptidase [Pyrinomonadaceae bacterium]
MRVLLVAAALFVPVIALVWALSAQHTPQLVMPIEPPLPSASDETAAPAASATPPQGAPASAFTPLSAPPLPSPSPPPAPVSALPEGVAESLLIPVAGVRAEDLQDTYNDARNEGRTHNAIDIIAPRGTPVLACAAGTIVKLFNSIPGGITIYQLGADQKVVYYYAHLERYADGLAEGQAISRGQVIGYVGDTGNATPGNYHLHFSISLVSDPKRYWDGANVNPYPLLGGRK